MKKQPISEKDFTIFPLLQDVQQYFPEKILMQSSIVTFNPKEYITKMAEPLHSLFFLLKGKAKIYLNHENGKRTLLQFLNQGDFIGELTFVEAESMIKDVITMGEAVCLAVPIIELERATKADARFYQKIAQYIGKKLLMRMEHFSMNQSFELKYRLANVILETEVNNIYKEKNGEIADYLGVSYRHYLYVIHQFQENGYLKKIKHGYQIDKEKLIALVEEMKN